MYVKMLKKFGKTVYICYNVHKSRRNENDSMGGIVYGIFFNIYLYCTEDALYRSVCSRWSTHGQEAS